MKKSVLPPEQEKLSLLSPLRGLYISLFLFLSSYIGLVSRWNALVVFRSFFGRFRQKKVRLENQSDFGAGDEARTRYLHLGKVALYRMSYTRVTLCIIASFFHLSIGFFIYTQDDCMSYNYVNTSTIECAL